MDRIALSAQEREVLGKKVKNLRKAGQLPGHVFGKKVEGENVTVDEKDFLKVLHQAGETGLIDLKIGAEKVRPVLIRDLSHDPLTNQILNVDFYQVNLSEKVTVPVPLVLVGDEPESVHMGEAVVLQTLSEVQVEALPTDLVENIEVNITTLKQVDDSITVADLFYDHDKLTVLAEPEEVVVKLAPAVTKEMEALLEEQEAEAAAAAEAAGEAQEGEAAEGETPESKEGEGGESTEGETPAEGRESEEPAQE